jgi:hypothetical protein
MENLVNEWVYQIKKAFLQIFEIASSLNSLYFTFLSILDRSGSFSRIDSFVSWIRVGKHLFIVTIVPILPAILFHLDGNVINIILVCDDIFINMKSIIKTAESLNEWHLPNFEEEEEEDKNSSEIKPIID